MNELQVVNEQSMLPVADILRQAQAIQQVLKDVMQEGTHFGKIPGTSVPTLYKAGAEKIMSLFRLGIRPIVEDLSTPDSIRYRVILEGFYIPTGNIVGFGVGECSTGEEKYKWRSAVCQEEFDITPPDRRRVKFSSVWGRNRGERDIRRINQVRTEPADLANTVLKMAKKRAMTDLCLTATAASDIFTQDLEDLDEQLRQQVMDDGAQIAQDDTAKKKPEGKPTLDGEEWRTIYSKWASIIASGRQTVDQALSIISTRNTLSSAQIQAFKDVQAENSNENS